MTDRTLTEQPHGFDVAGQRDLLRADLEHLVVRVHDVTQGHGFGEAQGHRLLKVDVLAGVDGVDRHLGMPVLGRCDEHGMDVLALEQFG
jgi:hypothetical protein